MEVSHLRLCVLTWNFLGISLLKYMKIDTKHKCYAFYNCNWLSITSHRMGDAKEKATFKSKFSSLPITSIMATQILIPPITDNYSHSKTKSAWGASIDLCIY